MKAFGVRLAAGAVTILLGAIMAAQAQKDQQASTESAWTEEQIPPAKAVAPIGSESGLQTAQAEDIEMLKPVGETDAGDDSKASPVRLVQHTESIDSMVLPEIPADAGDAPQPKTGVGGRSVMKMRLPSFDEAPAAGASADVAVTSDTPADDAGPSFSMGMPIADTPDASFPEQPQMSEITFAETPLDEPSADASTVGNNAAIDDLAGQPPANDLRGGTFADPADAAAAGPAAMLTPVTGDGADAEQPQFADAPAAAMATPEIALPEATTPEATLAQPSGTTMRIHRQPAMKLEMGAAQLPMQADAGQPAAAPAQPGAPAATMGIASQPQIVGNGAFADSPQLQNTTAPNHIGNASASPYGQPAAATADQRYSQPAGGFGAADQYPAAAPQLPAPPLPAASSAASALSMQQQSMQSQSLASPAATYASPGQPAGAAIYQGVGYQQTGAPLPAGPTLASPGERYLDGPQSPSVVIHKRAPEEVKVGKPASFVITVKNVGGSKALNVQVHDRVPNGMTLTDATPRPNPKYQPELYWELGDLEPNQERTITLQLTPEQEGELGSVARVTFEAAASVRTISTRPELQVVQLAPETVLIGQQLEIELEVSNPGTGEATGVILQEDVPAGLEHPQGTQLDNLIGTLGPGEIRRQVLRMRAVKPGIVQNLIRVKGDDGLETTHTIAVEVVAPELKATLTGPSRRFLERQATYELEIANVGTAEAQNVELSVQLDRGFTFVKTDFEGQYDASRHAVFWSLPALPVGQSGKVPLTLLPVEEGNRVLQTVATADLGIQTKSESQVEVASLAELTFSISDTADPIEIGGDTVYEIRISNTGSRDDTNVKVALQLPQGLQLVEQGDFTPQGQGIIAFSPRALLKANDEMVYRVKARGIAAGRHLVKAIVTSDQSNVPVTKEESIMVYADR
ncbi:Large cysteine-rich periplasmic protein omcB precursor [Stieleria maiorica]|uniref:Large cysteine-rich periplasmic protein omcB n=1 Tax=Stieleria maiorica TaxID=2795974 RepID=A0A5B9M8H0_9BACT|nr:DUF11 domain-containing protein [Stieleria maiorica]QEF96973.1 Large cysteine-rich periplasmic protein omcB precursor [Stieleria maiorica]